MHLVGFIIRIFHDARSPEPQTLMLKYCYVVFLVGNLQAI